MQEITCVGRTPGSAAGEVWVSPDFNASLPEDVLKDFETQTPNTKY
jgi:hypothetical protein